MVRLFTTWTATRVLLGFTAAEIGELLGLAESTVKAAERPGANPSTFMITVRDYYTNLVESLDARERFYELRDALCECNYLSFTNEHRFDKLTIFRIALGLTASNIEKAIKQSQTKISRTERNTNDGNHDNTRKAIENYLTKIYSSMSQEDQERVGLREIAFTIATNPQKNPYRHDLEQKKLVAERKVSKIEKKMEEVKAMEEKKAVDKEYEFLKTYCASLEAENDSLLAENKKLKDSSKYDELRKTNAFLNKRINDVVDENNALKKRNSELENSLKAATSCNEQLANENKGITITNCTVVFKFGGNE